MKTNHYQFGSTCVDYVLDDNQNVSMILYPVSKQDKIAAPWEEPEGAFDARAPYIHGCVLGRAAYFHLVGQDNPAPGMTMKVFDQNLPMKSQTVKEDGKRATVETLLEDENGCQVLHSLTYEEGLGGFFVQTTFQNRSGKRVTLDMLSSFSLDNLSPFQADDAPNKYHFHRFLGGCSKEGKHRSESIEDLNLEKSWPGWPQNHGSVRFGTVGSWPTNEYFPTAVVEDREHGVFWGAQLACNSTWQMELTRWDDSLSFTGGLGDREFCGWKKHIEDGEDFAAPLAFVAVSDEDIYDCCGRLTDMMKPARRAYGEEGLPIAFNEYCATWGKPTQEKMLNFCKVLKPYGVKYLICDAGWCSAGHEQDGNGEWTLDETIFPDVKGMNRTNRENGMIPGIWFEHECVTKGSGLYEAEYDHRKLKKDGFVLKNWNRRSFWDMRRQDVNDDLKRRVIDFLRDNGFGYIKVDYNANIGMEVDGAESGAEGLRQHLVCARDFFLRMKQEVPGLIVECCSAGGNRNEPSMLSAAAVCSFSDAHECVDIPYIAANMMQLVLPTQNSIWCVVRPDDDEDRLRYSLAATFFGRVCLSGDMDKLDDAQSAVVHKGLDFYRELDNILLHGRTKIYGNRSNSMRHPEGVQVVMRKTADEMMIVYHTFAADLQKVSFEIPEGFTVCDSFYGEKISVQGTTVTVCDDKPFTAGAVYLKKTES